MPVAKSGLFHQSGAKRSLNTSDFDDRCFVRNAKRCRHCDEEKSGTPKNQEQEACWNIQLDRDLLETLNSIYPDWFTKTMNDNSRTNDANLVSSSNPNDVPSTSATSSVSVTNSTRVMTSPPKSVIDTSPLSNAMDKNKESLKVKLMLRRPINQLIAQGILPSLKTPPAYHEQKRRLERAKTGDALRAKIQQRPSRLELESRHIIPVTEPVVAASLVEKQRMLKKAKIVDHLNDQLSHRPGPLELIKKNILHTEQPIEEAVKNGRISFRATSEGQLHRPLLPNTYITLEDDSAQSKDNFKPQTANIVLSLADSGNVVVTTISETKTGLVLNSNEPCRSPATSLVSSSTSTLSPASSVASPAATVNFQKAVDNVTNSLITESNQIAKTTNVAATKDLYSNKNRKKAKATKPIPKTRTIKFHEYKGPPNSQKQLQNSSAPSSNPAQTVNVGIPVRMNSPTIQVIQTPVKKVSEDESSYDLLLKQQQLFLQWQLQSQHKFPKMILPSTTTKNCIHDNVITTSSSTINSKTVTTSVSTSISSNIDPVIIKRLEDMKVSDLKIELKKRNLPVSGSKPQLIERLKPFFNQRTPSVFSCSSNSNSNSNSNIDITEADESIVTSSSSLLVPSNSDSSTNAMDVCCDSSSKDDLVKEQQRQIEELQRQLTKSQFQLQQIQSNNSIIVQPQSLPFVNNSLLLTDNSATSNSNPNTTNIAAATLIFSNNGKLSSFLTPILAVPTTQTVIPPPPPLPQPPTVTLPKLKPKRQPIPSPPQPPPLPPAPPTLPNNNVHLKSGQFRKTVKSEMVDDVLEILIRNGELSPSAVQDPITPVFHNGANKSIQPEWPTSGCLTNNSTSMFRDNDNKDEPMAAAQSNNWQNEELSDFSLDSFDFSNLEMDTMANNTPNLGSSIPMDTDETDWLDLLLPSNDNLLEQHPHPHPPNNEDHFDDNFDLFNNLNDELKVSLGGIMNSSSNNNNCNFQQQWDKIDFAR